MMSTTKLTSLYEAIKTTYAILVTYQVQELKSFFLRLFIFSLTSER